MELNKKQMAFCEEIKESTEVAANDFKADNDDDDYLLCDNNIIFTISRVQFIDWLT